MVANNDFYGSFKKESKFPMIECLLPSSLVELSEGHSASSMILSTRSSRLAISLQCCGNTEGGSSYESWNISIPLSV